METLEVQRVRGMNDALPPEDARLRGLTATLRDHFERFGYRGIDTPVIENLEASCGSPVKRSRRACTASHTGTGSFVLRPELNGLGDAGVRHILA